MLLHRLVDRALDPLLAPMQFTHATEGYVSVTRDDLDRLAVQHGDPQAVLTGFGPRTAEHGMLIAEPTFASAVLSRIWRSDRNASAPLTQVEGEILRQFLARLVGAWAGSWMSEGVKLVPEFSMAGAMSMLRPQLSGGTWHVARTVIRERDSDTVVGVLLFCYPEGLLPLLDNEARSILWRSRIERGLSSKERTRLADRLAGPLRHVTITAPVRIQQPMTLGALDSLERGDVIAFDERPTGSIAFDVLGREVIGRLARTPQGALALTLTGADGVEETPEASGSGTAGQHDAGMQQSGGDGFGGDTGLMGGGPGEEPPEPDEWSNLQQSA